MAVPSLFRAACSRSSLVSFLSRFLATASHQSALTISTSVRSTTFTWHIDDPKGASYIHRSHVRQRCATDAILLPPWNHAPADQAEAWTQSQSFMNQDESPEHGAAIILWAAIASVWEGRADTILLTAALIRSRHTRSRWTMRDLLRLPSILREKEMLRKQSAELAGVDTEVYKG
jgi:hypothetical protein